LSVTINESPLSSCHNCGGITTGSDGKLWFTDELRNMIGQFDRVTHAIAESPVPAGSEPGSIAAGP
jgi:streptogramin lyase